jgi:DNA topoisomerase-1
VAVTLGNTRAVCRNYYIHPAIMDAYLDGTLAQWFNSPRPRSVRRGLTSGETAVLRLLQRHRAITRVE